jgi:hypothetical protein
MPDTYRILRSQYINGQYKFEYVSPEYSTYALAETALLHYGTPDDDGFVYATDGWRYEIDTDYGNFN